MLTPEGKSAIVHERLLERLLVFVAAIGGRFNGCICCDFGRRGFSAPGEYRRQEYHGDKEDSCLHGLLMYVCSLGSLLAGFFLWLLLNAEKVRHLKKNEECMQLRNQTEYSSRNVSSGGQWKEEGRKEMNNIQEGGKVSRKGSK